MVVSIWLVRQSHFSRIPAIRPKGNSVNFMDLMATQYPCKTQIRKRRSANHRNENDEASQKVVDRTEMGIPERRPAYRTHRSRTDGDLSHGRHDLPSSEPSKAQTK